MARRPRIRRVPGGWSAPLPERLELEDAEGLGVPSSSMATTRPPRTVKSNTDRAGRHRPRGAGEAVDEGEPGRPGPPGEDTGDGSAP